MALMHDGQIRQTTPETPGPNEAWWKNKAAVVALIGTLAAGGIGGAVLASGEDTPNPEPTATAPENPTSPETNPSTGETPTNSQTEQTQSPETENELEGFMPLEGNDPEDIILAYQNNMEMFYNQKNSEFIEKMYVDDADLTNFEELLNTFTHPRLRSYFRDDNIVDFKFIEQNNTTLSSNNETVSVIESVGVKEAGAPEEDRYFHNVGETQLLLVRDSDKDSWKIKETTSDVFLYHPLFE